MNPFEIRDSVSAQDILDMGWDECFNVETNFDNAIAGYSR
ncbi:hypothetical protein LCGC14_1644100 [marine sediment metagenome]|uniref:Uncharacterized protein n=1 Tax=marine sediment metagenome TaxID=412755 RepID=A0A0F9HYR1_9ZZZZ